MFSNYFLVNNKASAVSFKPSLAEFSIEDILAVDLALEEDLKLMPLGGVDSLRPEIPSNNWNLKIKPYTFA